MKKTLYIGAILFLHIQASAYKIQIKTHDSIRRLAGQTEETNSTEKEFLVYESPDSKSGSQIWKIDANDWLNSRYDAGTRYDFLVKLYYANTKEISNTKQKHVGCFLGDANQVAHQFFRLTSDNDNQFVNKSDVAIRDIESLLISVSEDRKMLGMEFVLSSSNGRQTFHFRLPHCIQGSKNPLIDLDNQLTVQNDLTKLSRQVASVEILKRKPNAEMNSNEDGFIQQDQVDADDSLEFGKKLPRFELFADYSSIKPSKNKRPWAGIDITKADSGEKFALTVLDYFYESMVQNMNDPNDNFIAQKIPAGKDKWCHMPWLNVGDTGREAIHGLTKERDLQPSKIYPSVGSTPEKAGADWGIGFYNDVACAAIQKVFGDRKNPNANPNFSNITFPDGSASVKVLFTTAALDELQESFTWTAHVSEPKTTLRKLKNVRMVQIDVAVKDSKIKGVRKEVDNWMMTTFYFDKNYKPSYQFKNADRFKGTFAGLLKMRPIGIQTGFDPSTSLIFKGALTNSTANVYYPGDQLLMNGPADNSKGSCMSCHGAAGTLVSMVPGVKNFDHYKSVKSSALDFSMQMAFAKRNYETRPGQAKAMGLDR